MINTTLAIILIVLSIYFIVTEFINCKECFHNFGKLGYLGVASKCFDCEKQYPPEQRWKAQPSKCFSCERELAARHGDSAAYHGKQQKCLSCGY